MDRKTVAAYDIGAAAFAADWQAQPAPSDLHAVVRCHFRPGLTADIGCGAGREVAWLAANGFQAIGYDASMSLLAEARNRYPILAFVSATLPGLAELRDGGFDNVLCETVIMHLPREQIAPAVARLLSILKSEGVLYLSWRVTEGADRRDARGRLYTAFTGDLVRDALAGATVLLDERGYERIVRAQNSSYGGPQQRRVTATTEGQGSLEMEISLKGRCAIVTGGSKGIGFAVATRFAKSGADVAIFARTRETLDEAVRAIKQTTNGKVVGVQADVGNAADIQRAYNETMQALGKVDILVNNAGTSRNGAFEKLTDEIMQQDLNDKLFAAIRLIRLVSPQMKERRWGRIINVLNIGAKAPRANSMPTSVSRAAGMAMTKALSQEFAPHNVLVNAMLVGLIEADQHVQRAKQTNVPLSEYYKAREKEIPIGRVGKADEFANLACFLASDAASYVSGTATNVDGGRSPVV